MILFLILVVLTTVSYWCTKVIRRRVARSSSHRDGRGGVGAPDIPAQDNPRAHPSLAWTAVDDRQFQRLADGMSPDDGG